MLTKMQSTWISYENVKWCSQWFGNFLQNYMPHICHIYVCVCVCVYTYIYIYIYIYVCLVTAIYLPYNSAVLLLDIYPREIKPNVYTKTGA